MPDIVYCDNKDCVCYDDYYERCDAYRLVIERGVCTGSPRHGRNVSENDLDERLKAENAKLRGLVRELYNRLNGSDENCGECRSSCDYDAWNFGDPKCIYAKRLRELGIEV